MTDTLKPSLHDVAVRYGCDKLHSHSYIPVYADLFANRTVRRLLEIGIGFEDLMKPFVPHYVHGASLRMWADYFPDAEIYACDIREDTLINEGRIHSFICDQSSVTSLVDLMVAIRGACDVVIDDGSHVTEHQVLTAKVLLPSMAAGTLYVIEDVRDFESGTWIIQELAPYVLKRRGAAIDLYQGTKRPDDNLVIVKL